MKQERKVTVIGAGSTYTPELIEGLIDRRDSLPVGNITLMDIHAEKLDIIARLSARMLAAAGFKGRLVTTQNLEEALTGADYVMAQIRVGGLEARIRDEKIPLKYGLLGQETTGIGGFMNALRTIPEIMNIARTIERVAPDAWLINFSNPSGILTETVLNHTQVRMIGLCNGPICMLEDIRKNLAKGRAFDYTYVGLNHLSWITSVVADGEELIGTADFTKGMPTGPKNIPSLPFSETLLKTIGGYPAGYLSYYYLREAQIKKGMEAQQSRGELCMDIEKKLLTLYQDETLSHKPEELSQRGGALYSTAAISLVDAIENDRQDLQVVNVLNGGAIPFMDVDDAVEAACIVGKDGAKPVKVASFDNRHIVGLMKAVKAYEKLAVQAGLHGDYEAALQALLVHPLVGDYDRAKPALDEMLEANKAYLPAFYKNV